MIRKKHLQYVTKGKFLCIRVPTNQHGKDQVGVVAHASTLQAKDISETVQKGGQGREGRGNIFLIYQMIKDQKVYFHQRIK
jgi:hypothetical protein